MSSLFNVFILKSMNILKIKDIYEFEMAKLMYLCYYYKLSQNFDQYIKSAANHHKYVTRSIKNKSFYL